MHRGSRLAYQKLFMDNKPIHIAIIPDGNRRWAKRQLLNPWKGHEVAIENFRSSLEWCYNDPRVDTLTIWGFSTENWKREKKEVEMLMNLFAGYLQQERNIFTEKNIRVVHAGRQDRLPEKVLTLLHDIETETKNNSAFTFQLAIDYGGQDEIVRALNKVQHIEPGTWNQELVRTHLDHPELPDIDLIIRTSGEHRTSNFFLWQSTYAEWIFLPKLFPEFSAEDLAECVDEFNTRTRRFGGG